MNVDRLQTRLIAAARAAGSDDSVPFGFQTRVMARVRNAAASTGAAGDWIAEWTRGFWRAAASSVGLCVLALAVHVSVPSPVQDWADSMEVLSADLENSAPTSVEPLTEL